MLRLVAGTNEEGYFHALHKCFDGNQYEKIKSPTKSSLSEFRAKICWSFFKDIFEKLIASCDNQRVHWKGLFVFAIDGTQLSLPREKDFLRNGIRGNSLGSVHETHRLKLYLTHCYDVLSGVSKNFLVDQHLNEQRDARELLLKLPRKSLVLYDRLYLSYRLINEHFSHGSFFLARAKRGSLKKVEAFYQSRKQFSSFSYKGKRLYLIKVKNPTNNKKSVFVTNLPKSYCSQENVELLYAKRWEVETSFRELKQTLKVEQWHSKSLNGILQELYAAFWLLNYTKIQMLKRTPIKQRALTWSYKKANFKLILSFVKENFTRILQRIRGVLGPMKKLMNLSTEQRKHKSRLYPRVIKKPKSKYPHRKTRPLIPFSWPQNPKSNGIAP